MPNPNVQGTGANAQNSDEDTTKYFDFRSIAHEAQTDKAGKDDISFRSYSKGQTELPPVEEEAIELHEGDFEVLEEEMEEVGKETADKWFNTKGITADFPRSDGTVTRGKIIEWDIVDPFLVVGKDLKTGKYVKKRVASEILFKMNPDLKETIDELDTATEAREKLTTLFDESVKEDQAGTIKEAM